MAGTQHLSDSLTIILRHEQVDGLFYKERSFDESSKEKRTGQLLLTCACRTASARADGARFSIDGNGQRKTKDGPKQDRVD